MPFDNNLKIYDEYDGYSGQTIKQADTVMLTYPLNFPMASGVGLNDLNYYAPRTDLQGPAMTDAIHSIDASALNALAARPTPTCPAATSRSSAHPTTSSPKPAPGPTPALTS